MFFLKFGVKQIIMYYCLKFIEYFEKKKKKKKKKTFYKIKKNWNYYNNIKHITINVSELFNNYLNNLVSKEKTSFYKLIYALKQEEFLSYNNYIRKGTGI